MKNSRFIHTQAFILIALLSLVYFACDDAGIGPPKPRPFIIAGTVAGWTPQSNALVAQAVSISGGPYTLASSSIDTGGNFGFFPPQVDESTLFPTDSIFNLVCNSGPASFAPPNAKGTVISSFAVINGSQPIGYIDCNNYNQSDPRKAGDFDVIYVFVNENVAGNGFRLCGNDTVAVYGTAQLGWNKIFRVYKRIDPGSTTIVYYNSSFVGATWKYHSY